MKQYKDLDQLESIQPLIDQLEGLPHDLLDVEWHNVEALYDKSEALIGNDKDATGVSPLLHSLLTSITLVDEMGMSGACVLAVLLYPLVSKSIVELNEVQEKFGQDVVHLLTLLDKISDLYARNAVLTSDNFSHFLLSFAEDVRVILILIADRLVQLRLAGMYMSEVQQVELSVEASFLYAPLAHRMGLYNIKGEMEDLCLKYTDRKTFNFIKEKLAATKQSRDAYIEKFIQPVKKSLEDAGLHFSIKGRTKSISSIRNKLVKQRIEFESIYDLFAIRIILDVPLEEERSQCWKAYSIITDMYQPNPKRLKDWISIPKSNGYESLHITVMGPEQKWVEVQIRSERMDEIAEKGLAAHWKYKGVKSESGLDEFMTGVRHALENKSATSEEVLQEFKLTLYDDEIYVFTPKGDLQKLPRGATILDFAYAIHSGLGAKTVSAQVNGRNVSIRHQLENGDMVVINTSNNQTPKVDWLKYVVTSKARSKIKQALRVESDKAIALVKEEVQRKMRNRKLEYDDALFGKLLKRKGYKVITDFYKDIQEERIDLNTFLDEYKQELQEKSLADHDEHISADRFTHSSSTEQLVRERDDILTIDNNLSGLDYQLAKCCNPIYGDPIFAFASRSGVKIHRLDCPNAPDLFNRFGYRILKAKWKGNVQTSSEVVLRIVGKDDLSVVHNIISQVQSENKVALRSYDIHSADGLFQADFTLYLKEKTILKTLIKTLKESKGVKSIERIR